MKDIENILRRLLKVIKRRRFRNLKFAIVSNNCWGGEVYEKYSKEYNTPFIGLFLKAPDYIRLVENFNYYINQEIIFFDNVNVDYPVGKLDDIEIYFMHYENQAIAKEKWDRRMKRFIKFSNDYPDKVFFKMCDREDGNLDILNRFHKTDHKN
ncbi:MAG: DUF1919 domain-containing protein, partial [Gelidibacter sp.]